MATGVLDTEIKKYLPLLGIEEKKSLLSVIKSFLNLKNDASDEIDIQQYNKEIDAAMARIDNGDMTTHEYLEKKMETQLLDENNTPIPDWQIKEIRERKEYYKKHPDGLISWEAAQKMIRIG